MKYRKKYIVFFALIVLLLFASQTLIHFSIKEQKSDARIINLSGRQRMLSQNICKTALLIQKNIDQDKNSQSSIASLRTLAIDWRNKHLGLKYRNAELGLEGKNSSVIQLKFDSIQPIFDEMYGSILAITNSSQNSNSININEAVDKLLDNEGNFLRIMDRIVFQYDRESKWKLTQLRKIEIGIAIMTFLTILLEVIFIISPMIKQLVRTNAQLEKFILYEKEKNQELKEKKQIILNQKEVLTLKNEDLILARKKAEAAAEAKSLFLSNMSHEIRTPLNGVIGMTNILLEENPTDVQKEYLNTLKFSAANLMGIINDILDFNKIDAGKLSLEKVDFNLPDTLNSIFKSFNPKAKEKVLQFRFNQDEKTPLYVTGDPTRLSQILNNLIGNALKFTVIGYILLEVKVTDENEKYTTLRFSVEDSGIGIEAEKLQLIFESFSQADSNTTRLFGGTGLGLAITKKLVELHGSKIFVESTVGKGSKFFFDITYPHAKQVDRKDDDDLNVSIKSLKFKANRNVLLVDDNVFNLKVAERFLKYWDLKYDTAKNGQEALDLLSKKEYHVVLMDIQMPIMDGFTAAKTIRQWTEDKYKVLPIIALSASAMEEVKRKAFQVGMNDFLLKPFNPRDLYAILERHLVD